jgi:hypothetical protein
VARILLGDAERNRLVSALREHYAQGRLSLDELRRRAELVYASSYLDEAQAALAELPALAGDAPAARPPSAARQGWPRRRGHAHADRPEPGWTRTDERFRDPSSGQIMRVWVDPADGGRHYVPDEAAGG